VRNPTRGNPLLACFLVEAGRVADHTIQAAAWLQGSFMGLLLLIVVILLLFGGLPTWNHSQNWGYGPSGVLGLVLVVIVVLVLMDHVHLTRF
jgi:hypothetical protein